MTLISCGATAATRNATFPLDEELEPKAIAEAKACASAIRSADRFLRSPALAAGQTALALGIGVATGEGDGVEIDAALADLDHGRWAGRSLMEIQAEEPVHLAAWLTDPRAAPHGGEAVIDLIDRLDVWLTAQTAQAGHVLAITHAACIRAALIAVLDAELEAFWRIDIAPLTFTSLSAHDGRWRLRTAGCRLKDIVVAG